MSDITVDPRDAFEKVFPPPKHVIRCGNGYACTEYNAWGAHNFIRQWEGWSAAMLQGAENAESPTTMQTAPALDSSSKNSESPSGNSPVIPDGWVACSERMPEDDDFVYIWPRPDFGVELHVAQYGKFDKRDAGWYAQVCEQNYGIEYYPIKVTHWMPLPASPQQEVK